MINRSDSSGSGTTRAWAIPVGAFRRCALALLVTGAAFASDADLAQYDQLLMAVGAAKLDSAKAIDEATIRDIGNLGAAYRRLSDADKTEALQRTPSRLREIVDLGIQLAEKNETIAAGWGHPRDYYARILDAVRTATPADGKDHCFAVVISADRVTLTPIDSIPEGRGASSSSMVAKSVAGLLTAAFVFSDMGHAGVWGILFSDAGLPLHTTSAADGPHYWMFTDVGDQLFPHIYQAWNNLD